jgi:hypothetical protein
MILKNEKKKNEELEISKGGEDEKDDDLKCNLHRLLMKDFTLGNFLKKK